MRNSAFAERYTRRPPAIELNGVESVAGQVAPTIRREDLRPLPTRQEQARAYERLQQQPREAPAYQAPGNQFAEAGNQILEGTGLPSVRRSAAAFADNRPREGFEEGAMGALSLATLGVGGRSAMPRGARPGPVRAPMAEPAPSGALRLPPRVVAPDAGALDASPAPDGRPSQAGLDAGAMTALRAELRDHDFPTPAQIPDLPRIEVPLSELRPGQMGSLDRADASGYAALTTDAPPILVRRQGRNGWHIIDGNRRAEAARLRGDRNIRVIDATELFTNAPARGPSQ